jgi:hypothetical protein
MIKLMNIDTSGRVPCPVAENMDLASLRGIKTLGGASLKENFPQVRIVLKDGDESPSGLVDYFKVGLLNVISLNLKNILESLNVEMEYILTTVLYRGKPAPIEYFVANPLKRFDAIDAKNSKVVLDEELGDALSVEKLVIDESKFQNVKLAVIGEIQLIGVQEEIAAAIDSSGCIGCAFIDPIAIHY